MSDVITFFIGIFQITLIVTGIFMLAFVCAVMIGSVITELRRQK